MLGLETCFRVFFFRYCKILSKTGQIYSLSLQGALVHREDANKKKVNKGLILLLHIFVTVFQNILRTDQILIRFSIFEDFFFRQKYFFSNVRLVNIYKKKWQIQNHAQLQMKSNFFTNEVKVLSDFLTLRKSRISSEKNFQSLINITIQTYLKKKNTKSTIPNHFFFRKNFSKDANFLWLNTEQVRSTSGPVSDSTRFFYESNDQEQKIRRTFKPFVNRTIGAAVSVTYEEIGLFPRSFSRVFDRFIKQVFSDVEDFVLQEYRFYRYLFLTTFKCLFILLFFPFLVNLVAKNYIVQPVAEFFWNTKQTEIFLNSYQQKRAFSEMHDFEEKLYFESLQSFGVFNDSFVCEEEQLSGVFSNSELPNHNSKTINDPGNKNKCNVNTLRNNEQSEVVSETILKLNSRLNQNLNDNTKFFNKKTTLIDKPDFFNLYSISTNTSGVINSDLSKVSDKNLIQNTSPYPYKGHYIVNALEQRFHQKTLELAFRYNNQSIQAITNFFADLLSFITLFFLFFILEIQINITKSFLLEVFFGLDDSKKSLLILLITDLLVGYHSSNLWELFFQFLFFHYGLPENQTGIFLLVATFPVLLDVLFKYLIFRHLNRASPATVATYHAMIE